VISTGFAVLEAIPALAVLEDSSRLLLTIGVGLFLAYIVLIVGANTIGFIHRQVTSAIRRPRTDTHSQTASQDRLPVSNAGRILEKESL